jgi:hypothetical protein
VFDHVVAVAETAIDADGNPLFKPRFTQSVPIVGIVTAINAVMDAAVATRLRNLRAIHSSI